MSGQTLDVNRRDFLAAAGLGMATLGFGQSPQTSDWTDQEKANVQVVNGFLHAWWIDNPIDWEKVASHLADDCLCWGSSSKVFRKKPEAIESLKGSYPITSPRTCRLVRTYACGPMVMHERYESTGIGREGRPPSVWHGVGVFEVRNGKIMEWRAYTIENAPGLTAPAGSTVP